MVFAMPMVNALAVLGGEVQIVRLSVLVAILIPVLGTVFVVRQQLVHVTGVTLAGNASTSVQVFMESPADVRLQLTLVS
jgi:hypothetical protein